jgi:hypothetical protein
MKCPYCSGDFLLTWERYGKAPFGRLMCPLCHTRLAGKHHWFYWPLMLLGCCTAGIPLAYLGIAKYGFTGGLAGWIIGAMLSGIPFDKYLENKFSVLEVSNRESSRMPGGSGV